MCEPCATIRFIVSVLPLLSSNVKVKIYKTIILPVVLYGRESWSLTLREERRPRVFANRVQRGMFGPKRDEVTGEWRKLHSGEFHNLYSSQSILRQIKSRRSRGVGMWQAWERGDTCTGFWWESLEEKDHLKEQGVDGRMGSEWTLRRLVGGGVEWIRLAQNRDRWRAVVNAVMNLRVLAPQS
jgi:hypothetical protein